MSGTENTDWRKSSYSNVNTSQCVEVSTRRKSTYSSANGGQCVETASGAGSVAVRDTTDRNGVTLSFSPEAWAKFTGGIR